MKHRTVHRSVLLSRSYFRTFLPGVNALLFTVALETWTRISSNSQPNASQIKSRYFRLARSHSFLCIISYYFLDFSMDFQSIFSRRAMHSFSNSTGSKPSNSWGGTPSPIQISRKMAREGIWSPFIIWRRYWGVILHRIAVCSCVKPCSL